MVDSIVWLLVRVLKTERTGILMAYNLLRLIDYLPV
jgi:hypothetical protein